MPLENILKTQTYLVEDTLSLADIAVALDLKLIADKVLSKSSLGSPCFISWVRHRLVRQHLHGALLHGGFYQNNFRGILSISILNIFGVVGLGVTYTRRSVSIT